jgi:hypothetical protein
MARRQHHNSISLFPFLAVLVCAMGSLILLLLVMTRKIRQDQQADVTSAMMVAADTTLADRSTEIDDLEAQIASAQSSLAAIQSQTDSLVASVTERRDQIVSLRQELSDLKNQLSDRATVDSGEVISEALQETRQLKAKEAALLRQLKTAEKRLFEKQQQLAKADDTSKEAELLLREKHSDLLRLRAATEEAQQRYKTVSGTATLLEFSNSTGTSRTPIAIDVSAAGFELLPNGIRITPGDMEGFPVRDNPLLSAILTAHRHRAQGAVTDEPYVLLLVRPDGALTFYGAQRVLMESGIHYGYELVEPERQIVAGDPDSSEVPIVMGSIQEAFRRRDNMYAKLMAIAQQKSDLSSSNGETRSGANDRRLTVRPDGRVVLDEGATQRPLDGRFYAGGMAPPSSLMKNRPVGGYRGATGDEKMSPADAEKLAEEFAAQYVRQQQAARGASSATPPLDGLAKNATAEPTSTASADSIRSPAEQKFADAMFGSDDLPSASLSGARGSGNESRGSESAVEKFDGSPPGLASVGRPSNNGQLAGTTTDSFLPSTTKSTTNNTGKPAENEWLGSSLLASDDNTAAGKSSSATQSAKTGSPSSSLLFAGEPGGQPSTGIPDLSKIDPDLLKRLSSGKNVSSSLATPIGITVFLDAHHMTIGQQSAVDVNSENLDDAFANLLTGINTEVNDIKRKPNEPIMPIVKFIVSPGGEKWRIPLAYSLKRTGIHSATVYELTPYMTTSDTTGRAKVGHDSE